MSEHEIEHELKARVAHHAIAADTIHVACFIAFAVSSATAGRWRRRWD
jgi:hypothetical protein